MAKPSTKRTKVVSIKPVKLNVDLPYVGFGPAVAMEGSCFDVKAVNKLLASTR